MNHPLRSPRINPLWGLLAYLCFIFAFGGASRHDVANLPYLRIGSALFAGLALYTLTLERLRPYRGAILLFGAYTGWIALQLVPFPPAIWTKLPGRELAEAAANVLGLEQPWRPFSLIPWRTENALLSLVVPWTVLLFAVQIEFVHGRLVVATLVGIGLLSGVLGLMQMLGPDGGMLYFYEITNAESAVGLFSNRNHNAAYLACCIPLAAYLTFTQLPHSRLKRSARTLNINPVWVLGAATTFVLSLSILATGSRAGMLAGALALVLGAIVVLGDVKARRNATVGRIGLVVAAMLSLVGALIGFALSSQDEAVERLTELDQSEELRLKVWGPIAQQVGAYGWTGSGIGTFEEIYKIAEPPELISERYLNHAHNDWLELALTGGAPAAVIVLIASIMLLSLSFKAWFAHAESMHDRALARIWSANILILALFSIGDYPLRTPSISGFFVLTVLCLIQAARRRGGFAVSGSENSSGRHVATKRVHA